MMRRRLVAIPEQFLRRCVLTFSLLMAVPVLCSPGLRAADSAAATSAETPQQLLTFARQQLTGEYYSEGANVGDLNGDGHADIVYGPLWFAGPDFKQPFELYLPVPQNREAYADNFFAWVQDFNGDGRNDVFVVGFPGTPAFVYENPGPDGLTQHWKKHQVFDWVSNESPAFTNLVGDPRPELICTRDGFFGYAEVNWDQPFGVWTFHPISEQIATKRFGHGLGVGDVNGDGRPDVLHAGGWFEQPEAGAADSRWLLHEVSFTNAYGGAEMYAYDVDGDGDNDVITSQAAHDFGLAWYEQQRSGNEVQWVLHQIMGDHPSQNRYGVLFSELHSVNLVDMNGDGLRDIVTGKTYYSHHKQSPLWDAGAVVYWFQLVRGPDGVDWIPWRADGEAGIGRQLSIADVNGDSLPDIVTGGMKGAHVLTQQRRAVAAAEWQAALPPVWTGPPVPSAAGARALRGPQAPLQPTSGVVTGALEGESLKFRITAGQARRQSMSGFRGGRWSGGAQLWWSGGRPGDVLTVELPEKSGVVDVELVLTCARDYAIVQPALDDVPLGKPIDLYNPEVISSGVLTFPQVQLQPGSHRLTLQLVGRHARATDDFMVGLDYVRLKAAGDKFADPEPGILASAADGRPLNLDFETGTLQDWTATGDAFAGQPIAGDAVAARRSDMHSGHAGTYWIGGYEKVQDQATGTLTSVPFRVTQPFATFLANGGEHMETRVELLRADTDAVIYRIAGQNSETLRQVVVDLRAHLGKDIRIRLVDEHRGGWGHLNFDHFRFHETRPAQLTPPLVQLEVDEYPHGGLSAEEAAAAMQLPEGFRVTVGAAEPDIRQPIAMALDDRGRVWVAEAYEYPLRAAGDRGRDRILIFEDRDGDGRLESQKVFAEGLNLVSGLEVGFGGVWVGAAPYLLFIPDGNADDVPDAEPQILLDGWGYQDTHETLNTFIWGPDGWLYGCHGVFTHSLVGHPGTPEEQRTPLNAAVWRYHPLRHEFEVFAHGTSNPWGVDFNDHGEAFVTACVIPHLYHIIPGARYQRQAGQHFNRYTYQDIVTIADHLHYLGATPHGGNNKSDEAGGGHAHAGAMIYLGGAWPQQYRNQIFMNNIHGQRLNTDVLKAQGSGYVGSHGPDFLLTGDRASQILNLRYGPDGQAWMIDWYDMQACHRTDASVHDRSNGRIYRIAYDAPDTAADQAAGTAVTGWQLPRGSSLAGLPDADLARLILHSNDWYVRHARRLLQERAAHGQLAPAAREFLAETAAQHADETRVLRAMWALHVTGGLDLQLADTLLTHASPHVRAWTVRLRMQQHTGPLDAALLAGLQQLAADDASPVVRLSVAAALQRVPLEQRWDVLAALCSHAEDADDQNLPLMYWYAAEPLAEADSERALALAMSAGAQLPQLRDFMLRRIGSSDSESALGVLIRGLGRAADARLQQAFLESIRVALRGQRQVAAPRDWPAVYARLQQTGNASLQLQATALGVTFGDAAAMAALRQRVLDQSLPVTERQVALESLLGARDPQLVTTLQTLLQEESVLRSVAVRGLSLYDAPESAGLLLAVYSQLTAEERRAALATLCSRATFAVPLLQAVQQKVVPSADLSADLVRQLQFLRHADVNRLLTEVWGMVRESPADKLQLIAEYRSLVEADLPQAADPELGRAVFARTCQKCHTLYGVGQKVGPDLTGSNRANLDYLLSNIVDPSAVMAREYQPTIVVTTDGRIVTGLVREEDDKSVTLLTSDATVIIPQSEIEERVVSDKSMMPDDQLKPFHPHEVRSLIAYLQGRQQVPQLAAADSVGQLFNGRDLTGWSGQDGLWSVENGEIVGRTTGLKRNEWLVSDLSAEDFELTLQVRLVGNAGNSGVQFRSSAKQGEVSGYQADIGPGWWGKLYEEHGRALLWDQSGEQHVRPDDWNTYVIRAQGSRIRTWINGQLCVDLDDPQGARRGIIALQLHSGGPTEVRFRNLALQLLPAETAAAE